MNKSMTTPSSTAQPVLDALDHVAVTAEDIPSAVGWYQQRFRCRVAYQDATWALLEFANARLALVTPGEHPNHMGLVSERAEEFGELKPHRDGTRSIYVLDPSGNAVEIMAPYL